MSLVNPARPASALLVILGLTLPLAPGQAKDKPPPRKPAATAPVARQVYAVRGGAAKELANALNLHFQADPSFQAIADAGSNFLLLSGTRGSLDEAVSVLREIDHPVRTVHLEVLLVEMSGGDANALEGVERSGTARDVLAKVRELQQKGAIASVKSVQLAVLERQVARAQVSENRPFVTGVVGLGDSGFGGRRAGSPGGVAMSRSITYRTVGTIVQVTPEVGADGLVSLDLRVEDSRMRAAEGGVALETDDKGTGAPATEFLTASLETRVRVRSGNCVMAQATRVGSKAGQAQTVILVSASIDEAGPKDGK